MGIFRQFPYSNFHDMNMDQILKIMREIQDEWTETKTEWASYKDFIDNYFANLDISAEVLQALRTVIDTGEFNEVADPVIITEVSRWLDENITPTTPVVDASLSIAGAAADAYVTGHNLKVLRRAVTHASNKAFNFIDPEWQQGSINMSGEISTSNGIRTPYIDISDDIYLWLEFPEGYEGGIYLYDANQTYLIRHISLTGYNEFFVRQAAYCRIIMAKTPTAATPPDDGKKLAISTWLNIGATYDLYPTGDNTVRTNEIRNKLADNGVCHLAPGDYYIGTLNMPQGTKLIGSGPRTRLIKSVYDSSLPYAIRMFAECEIASLTILGQESELEPTEIGETNGIYIVGSESSTEQKYNCDIHDVWVQNCTAGGITFYGTGYSPLGGCHITNAFIKNCGIGVHLGKHSEYHRVNTVNCNNCYIGILNNGGNNVIVNSDFSSNVRGIVMDNTDGTMSNNSHGTFTGCTVNHTDNNTGTAIEIINMNSGEIFSDLQLFYGGIVITGSNYINFSNVNAGTGTPIDIDGGNLILFNNCVFRSTADAPVTIVNNNKVHFNNCYLRSGDIYDPVN